MADRLVLKVDVAAETARWAALSYEEKNRQLALLQKRTLDTFLAHGAISRAQHAEALRALAGKTGLSHG